MASKYSNNVLTFFFIVFYEQQVLNLNILKVRVRMFGQNNLWIFKKNCCELDDLLISRFDGQGHDR